MVLDSYYLRQMNSAEQRFGFACSPLLVSYTPWCFTGLAAGRELEMLWFEARTNKISFLYVDKIIAVSYSYSMLKYLYEFRSKTIQYVSQKMF